MSVIKATEIPALLEREQVMIVDARGGADAYQRYKDGHLKNALFADLETHLSHKSDNAANGGRHPLPSPQQFSALLSRLGITKDSYVIVYDDKRGANAAARFWWMMRASGHQKVVVVSGGLESIVKAGLEIVQGDVHKTTPALYSFSQWNLPLADINEVEKAGVDPSKLIVDVREAYRYKGESEPIDLVAGHIPGAINIPYLSNLDEQGEFLSAEELEKKYKEALGDHDPSNVIVHCGSGVTACHTLLAMHHAGFKDAKLYVGSWSEWSRRGK